jgi:Flp pilus assembly protein TadD
MLNGMRSALVLLLLTSLCSAQRPGPPKARQLFDHALAAQQRGDLATAIGEYQEVLKLEPGLVVARINLAAALLKAGRLDEAADNYRAALKRQPDNIQLSVLLGNCLVLGGTYGDAIRLLRPVEEAHPEDLDIAFVFGEALIRAEKLQEGLKLVQRVAAARNDAVSWMLAGMAQLKLGQYSQARDSLDRGLHLDPTVPGAYTLSGIAKLRTGDEEGAKAAYHKALEMDPNDFEASLRLGTVLRGEGDFDNAKSYLGRSLQINPPSMIARYQMAVTEMAAGDDAKAVPDLEAIVRDAPYLLKAHIQLAAIYYRLQRQEDGLRERRIVDSLLADPQKQDHQLEADPTLDADVSPVSVDHSQAVPVQAVPSH